MYVLNYNKMANSLANEIDRLARRGRDVDIVVIDPNPSGSLMHSAMERARQVCGYPENLHFSTCTVDK